MKPFRFTLQAVLTVRMNRESKALEAFAKAQADVERVATRFRLIQKEIEDTFADRRNALKTAASSDAMQQMQQGLRALKDAARRCQFELQQVQAILDEKSRALLEARRDREVVEKVQQRQLDRYQLESARSEQRVLDELASLKSVGGLALKWR